MLDSNDLLFNLFSKTLVSINNSLATTTFLYNSKDYITSDIITLDNLFWSDDNSDLIYKIFECDFYAVVVNTLIEYKAGSDSYQQIVKLLVPLSNKPDILKSLGNYEHPPKGKFKKSQNKLILVD